MILRLTRRAAKDIEDIADYIKAHDPAAALRVRTEIVAAYRAISRFSLFSTHARSAPSMMPKRVLVRTL